MKTNNQSYGTSSTTILDTLIKQALDLRASDIHLEPTKEELSVRMRIDGVLTSQAPISQGVTPEIISRVKVLSRLNIAEKRIPQDGKFTLETTASPIDFRVSTFPGLYGEKVVIRILDQSSHGMALDQLGFSEPQYHQFSANIQRNNGLLLVTGPTGSGKTTTLYAALNALNSPNHNIITLEDPIEYSLDGITQGQVNLQTGFTFERGIRALLRQDPDILMIGEIRDRQTARIAIEAALTGHLVFSTLHTNDAPSAVMRLMEMGIEPYLINASLIGVIAQRLTRTLCPTCKQPESQPIQSYPLGITTPYKPTGCPACSNHGFRGRTGIFEMLEITDQMRSLIVGTPSLDALRAQALAQGMLPLAENGAQKVNQGLICLQDALRIGI